MNNPPKELEQIFADVYHSMFEKSRSYNFTSAEQRAFNTGVADCFNDCYQAMLQTHVSREDVRKLVEALKYYADKDNWWGVFGNINSIHESDLELVNKPFDNKLGGYIARQALKEFGSGNE